MRDVVNELKRVLLVITTKFDIHKSVYIYIPYTVYTPSCCRQATAAVDKHHLAHSSRLPNDQLPTVSRRCKERSIIVPTHRHRPRLSDPLIAPSSQTAAVKNHSISIKVLKSSRHRHRHRRLCRILCLSLLAPFTLCLFGEKFSYLSSKQTSLLEISLIESFPLDEVEQQQIRSTEIQVLQTV